ncbi:MAG: ribonuclease P protein component [Methylophilaceae bacterium]|nr:ribonuclease P protein component [Methylophilaceae bacterium]
MAIELSFSKQSRIIKTDDFSSVFNFRKRITGKFLVIHYAYNQLNLTRLGLVVAKKTTRLSVNRNYMKRVLRELFRSRENDLLSVDLVVRPQKTFTPVNYLEIKKEFAELLVNLRQKLK